MKRCPSCKTVLTPEAKKCPSCGAEVRIQTQDNEYLQKDKWSFTGISGALDRKDFDSKPSPDKTEQFAKTMMATGVRKPEGQASGIEDVKAGSRFDKTMAMSAIDPRTVKQYQGRKGSIKEVDESSKTVALNTPIPPSQKRPLPNQDETILGIPKVEDLGRTIPIPLLGGVSTQARISKDEAGLGDRSNLTVPLSLKEAVSTQAIITKKDDVRSRSPNVTAPLELSQGVVTKAKVKRQPVPGDGNVDIKTAPFEPQVLVKSKSDKLKATAPFEIATPPKGSVREQKGRSSARKNRTQPRQSARDSGRRGRVLALIASFVLIATWFVPNIWIVPPVFPMDLLRSVRGLTLMALVTPPFIGAITLTLLIAPLNPKLRASIVLILGFCALAFPLLLGEPSLPIRGYLAFIIILVATAASVVIQTQTSKSTLGYLSLSLLPATFFGVAIYGIITSRLPVANIVVFKDPINVYAGMLLIAISIEELLSRPLK